MLPLTGVGPQVRCEAGQTLQSKEGVGDSTGTEDESVAPTDKSTRERHDQICNQKHYPKLGGGGSHP